MFGSGLLKQGHELCCQCCCLQKSNIPQERCENQILYPNESAWSKYNTTILVNVGCYVFAHSCARCRRIARQGRMPSQPPLTRSPEVQCTCV